MVEQKQSIAVESTIPSGMKIPQGENVDGKTSRKQKSTLELLEERNHVNVVKQAKEAGVSTEGSTLDILERINHAKVDWLSRGSARWPARNLPNQAY